jgi:hypothetical protein
VEAVSAADADATDRAGVARRRRRRRCGSLPCHWPGWWWRRSAAPRQAAYPLQKLVLAERGEGAVRAEVARGELAVVAGADVPVVAGAAPALAQGDALAGGEDLEFAVGHTSSLVANDTMSHRQCTTPRTNVPVRDTPA